MLKLQARIRPRLATAARRGPAVISGYERSLQTADSTLDLALEAALARLSNCSKTLIACSFPEGGEIAAPDTFKCRPSA